MPPNTPQSDSPEDLEANALNAAPSPEASQEKHRPFDPTFNGRARMMQPDRSIGDGLLENGILVDGEKSFRKARKHERQVGKFKDSILAKGRHSYSDTDWIDIDMQEGNAKDGVGTKIHSNGLIERGIFRSNTLVRGIKKFKNGLACEGDYDGRGDLIDGEITDLDGTITIMGKGLQFERAAAAPAISTEASVKAAHANDIIDQAPGRHMLKPKGKKAKAPSPAAPSEVAATTPEPAPAKTPSNPAPNSMEDLRPEDLIISEDETTVSIPCMKKLTRNMAWSLKGYCLERDRNTGKFKNLRLDNLEEVEDDGIQAIITFIDGFTIHIGKVSRLSEKDVYFSAYSHKLGPDIVFSGKEMQKQVEDMQHAAEKIGGYEYLGLQIDVKNSKEDVNVVNDIVDAKVVELLREFKGTRIEFINLVKISAENLKAILELPNLKRIEFGMYSHSELSDECIDLLNDFKERGGRIKCDGDNIEIKERMAARKAANETQDAKNNTPEKLAAATAEFWNKFDPISSKYGLLYVSAVVAYDEKDQMSMDQAYENMKFFEKHIDSLKSAFEKLPADVIENLKKKQIRYSFAHNDTQTKKGILYDINIEAPVETMVNRLKEIASGAVHLDTPTKAAETASKIVTAAAAESEDITRDAYEKYVKEFWDKIRAMQERYVPSGLFSSYGIDVDNQESRNFSYKDKKKIEKRFDVLGQVLASLSEKTKTGLANKQLELAFSDEVIPGTGVFNPTIYKINIEATPEAMKTRFEAIASNGELTKASLDTYINLVQGKVGALQNKYKLLPIYLPQVYEEGDAESMRKTHAILQRIEANIEKLDRTIGSLNPEIQKKLQLVELALEYKENLTHKF